VLGFENSTVFCTADLPFYHSHIKLSTPFFASFGFGDLVTTGKAGIAGLLDLVLM